MKKYIDQIEANSVARSIADYEDSLVHIYPHFHELIVYTNTVPGARFVVWLERGGVSETRIRDVMVYDIK